MIPVRIAVALGLALAIVVAASSVMDPGPAAASAEWVLRLGGSATPSITLQPVARGFEKAFPGVKVQIFPGLGSAGGVKALQEGKLDIALSSRPLKPSQKESGLVEIEYASTPLVFAVHGSVNISDITTQDLVDILTGQKTTWPDGRRLRLVLRPVTDSDTEAVRALAPALDKAHGVAFERPGMVIALTDGEALQNIAQLPGAIGITNLALIAVTKTPVKVLSLNGVVPTVKALANGSYPLRKSLYTITPAQPSAVVQQFTTFVLSVWGRKILTESAHLVKGAPANR